MNNNCDQDDFCTCECCEEFYNETDPTVETDLTLLVQEAQLELYRTQRILAEEQLILTHAGKEFLENQTAMMKEVMEAFREVVKKANG